METKDFYYDLPKELIAQTPVEPRDSSRLLVMDKTSGELEHRHFSNIIEYLQPGDCLIVNDSRVLPARIYGNKKDTGGHVEFLLLTQKEQDVWEVLAKPGRKSTAGNMVCFRRRFTGSSGAGNFGRWKAFGSVSLSGEFLCFVRANWSNAAAALHYREIRKSG